MARPKGYTAGDTYDNFCRVISAVMKAPRPITLAEIIDLSGVPTASAHRVLTSLRTHGICFVAGRLVNPRQIDDRGNAPEGCYPVYGINTTPGEFGDTPQRPVYR